MTFLDFQTFKKTKNFNNETYDLGIKAQPSSHPSRAPSNQPTSKPSRTVITTITVKQLILGITASTALTPAFQNAFIAALLAVLPKGCHVAITSIQLYYDDGSIENLRRRLLRSVIGVQINYAVSTPLASLSADVLQSALVNPLSVSTMTSLLLLNYPQGTTTNNQYLLPLVLYVPPSHTFYLLLPFDCLMIWLGYHSYCHTSTFYGNICTITWSYLHPSPIVAIGCDSSQYSWLSNSADSTLNWTMV